MIDQLRGAFSPNGVISKNTLRILVVVQAIFALIIWSLSPFAVLPTPLEVFNAMGKLWINEGLSHELSTSFLLNLKALALTAGISLGLAYLSVLPFFRPLVAAVSKGRFLGLIGLTFVFTLMVGMTVFFLTSMAAVVAEIPSEQFDFARTLRMPEWRVVWEVVILGTFDEAIEVLRQNAAIGWMMLTMVEGISRSEGGVGAMLLSQNKHFHLAEVFAIQILILFVGVLQDYGIGLLKKAACPYALLTVERR
jgi:NitT/TauT family transport system permease protein